MLPRCYHLKKAYRFRGPSVRDTYFTLKAQTNHQPHNRYLIILSKKTIPLAIHRNQTRRRFYHALQAHKDIPPPTDFLFIIHQDPKQLSFPEIATRIHTKLTQLTQYLYDSTPPTT